jgi:hypothetical protein
LATAIIATKEGYQSLNKDLLVDFWKDEGGLKGNCCYVHQVRGSRPVSIIDSAWESGFLWRSDFTAEIRTSDCETERGEVIRNESSSQISS